MSNGGGVGFMVKFVETGEQRSELASQAYEVTAITLLGFTDTHRPILFLCIMLTELPYKN